MVVRQVIRGPFKLFDVLCADKTQRMVLIRIIPEDSVAPATVKTVLHVTFYCYDLLPELDVLVFLSEFDFFSK